jgi:uncharacterized membrane protein
MGVIQKLNRLGERMADVVAGFVGTWKFITLYTVSMIVWMVLHVSGVLHIDSPEFMRWNLWLSYFAGIQASILLMASNRELEKDRRRAKDTMKLTEYNLDRVSQLSKDIDDLEALLTNVLEDIQENPDDTDRNQYTADPIGQPCSATEPEDSRAVKSEE